MQPGMKHVASTRGSTSLGKILGIRKIPSLNLHLCFGRAYLTFAYQIQASQKLEKSEKCHFKSPTLALVSNESCIKQEDKEDAPFV